MTTVAWDGTTMAADTLATDPWGMKEVVSNKILRGENFLLGSAGEHGQIIRWWETVCHLDAVQLIAEGYKPYEKNVNDPGLILACQLGLFRHSSGVFVGVSKPFHAVGSGRDYALAAMHMGESASFAVGVAMEFDVNTGGRIIVERL